MDKLTDAIRHWNVEGALQSPICITWLLNVPSTVANAVLWTCSGMMHICSYALDISSFERYAALAISLWMISWSGNGVTSLTVLLFCSRKSKTVRSLPFFFSIQSIGTAWCATVGIHHCAVVYLSIFWESSSDGKLRGQNREAMSWAFARLNNSAHFQQAWLSTIKLSFR